MSEHVLYIPLTPEQFKTKATELSTKVPGFDPNKLQGELEHSHVGIAYNYDGLEMLTITVLHKPHIYPESKVESVIKEWFN